MKSEAQIKQELYFLTEFCKKPSSLKSNRDYLEGRIFALLWVLGVPVIEAMNKSYEITHPELAVCPPPQV